MNELSAQVRREVSKSARSALRRAGRVPGVLYGRGREPMALSVDHKELVKLVREHHESGLVNLTIEDGGSKTQQQAIYKNIVSSSLRRRVTCIDFQAIREGEKVHIRVSVVTKGNPIGVVAKGGVLVHQISELDIKVLPSQIPEQIELDVAHLDIGDSIHVRDIKLEGIEIDHDPASIVVSVTHVKEEKVVAVAEAAPDAAATPSAQTKEAKGAAAPAKDAKGAAAPAKGGAAPAKGGAAAPAKDAGKKK